jgi:hypothetical protein
MVFDCQRPTTIDVLSQVGKVSQRVDKVLHVAARLCENLSSVNGLDLSDRGNPLFNCVSPTMQYRATLVRRQASPIGSPKCTGTRFHRRVNVLGGHFTDFGNWDT